MRITLMIDHELRMSKNDQNIKCFEHTNILSQRYERFRRRQSEGGWCVLHRTSGGI